MSQLALMSVTYQLHIHSPKSHSQAHQEVISAGSSNEAYI